MLNLVGEYLKDKELAWSPKTIASVRSTLSQVLPFLTGDPIVLWDELSKTQKPYSRVTTWGRVCGFWDFAKPGDDTYRDFRKKNSRLFRNVYVRTPATESMREAKARISQIDDESIQRKALELLYSGMRWGESLTLDNGFVVGKTGKRRVNVPKVPGPAFTGCYMTFFRALKSVGLKPHDLRKIGLTDFAESGANVFELKEIAGWSNINSATAYIGVKDKRIKEIMALARKKSE